MMYFSLFFIGAFSLQEHAVSKEVIRALEGTRIEDDYIVTLKEKEFFGRMSQDAISEIIHEEAESITANAQGVVKHEYSHAIKGFAATLSKAGLQNVLNDDRVESVEEDGIVKINVGSWGLDRIDDYSLPLDNSYTPAFGNGGEGVTAYIIDTGILDTHNEFEGRANQAYNSAGGSNIDCNGHGTHVAGTIGAKTYGVAPKAKLVGVKVLSCGGSGSWSGVIAGINWVIANANKPATANMSLGGGRNAAMNAAVKSLVASGVTTVVAAGNSNRDACSYSPASEPFAITVGSTTKTDSRSYFSNWGACVDVFAPGSDIKAPWIGSNTATRTISGTSMATPHVCGGVALFLGQDPNLSPNDVADILLKESTSNTITNIPCCKGTPNQLLYIEGTKSPSVSSKSPSFSSKAPTFSSKAPSFSSKSPSFSSKAPSFSSKSPTFSSKSPSFSSKSPSFSSKSPTTEQPTGVLTLDPTKEPTEEPTEEPTNPPTPSPTEEPTGVPTEEPTNPPTPSPTNEPTEEPTNPPTPSPTSEPTEEPTNPPTPSPTEEPTEEPTNPPTSSPTEEPTAEPTEVPTVEPTEVPTITPTDVPTVTPTETPVCKFANLKLCLKGGCIWTPEKRNKPAKCAPCSDEKKSKSCVKNGCIWKDAKGKKPAECGACADQKTKQCSKKGCVATKAKGKTTCTSCVSLSISKTKCYQGKCAYDIKKKACATCISVTKEKSCDEQKGCAWKPGKRGKKGTCDKKKGKIVLDCCDWGSEPCDLDCNARQETLDK